MSGEAYILDSRKPTLSMVGRKDVVMHDQLAMDAIVGAQITRILWSSSVVTFETDKGAYTYRVFGDCCSNSYFHDIIGVGHLLQNGPVTAFEPVQLQPGDPGHPKKLAYPGDPEASDVITALAPEPDDHDDVVRVYGYRLTTEHPLFGPVSTVLAFRNSSNGYYGGWMERVSPDSVTGEGQASITTDILGD
jgi:hypothetical protein